MRPFRRLAARFLADESGSQLRSRRLPILMYHSISDDPEAGTSPYYKACTSPRRFAEQMQTLADAGWRGVSLVRAVAALHEEFPTGEKLVAITFDDGYRDFYSAAIPVLSRLGFSATMYLPTAFIAAQRRTFKTRECLTWSEVRELHSGGMEFGSHTVNHPILLDLTGTEISLELRDSKEEIEQQLGVRCESFAYPYAFPEGHGDFARAFREQVAAVGYGNCVTTMIGRSTLGNDPYLLPRLPVNGADDRELLLAKMRGDYDWLGGPQRGSKWLRRVVRRAR